MAGERVQRRHFRRADTATSTQVSERVVPCTLVDVRSAEEVAEAPAGSFGFTHPVVNVPGEWPSRPCPSANALARAESLHAPCARERRAEAELPAVMRPRGKVWEERFDQPLPGAKVFSPSHLAHVFVSESVA